MILEIHLSQGGWNIIIAAIIIAAIFMISCAFYIFADWQGRKLRNKERESQILKDWVRKRHNYD